MPEDLSSEFEIARLAPLKDEVEILLGKLGSRDLTPIKPVEGVITPQGNIGLSSSWLAELVEEASENEMVWIRFNNEKLREDRERSNFVEGGVVIDYESREVLVDGTSQQISKQQFDILALLATNRNKVVRYDQIIDTVWGDWYGSRVLAVAIANIRKKVLGEEYRWILKTKFNIGYMLSDTDKPE